MSTMPDLSIHLLPRSHPDPAIWTKLISQQKSLRLRALQASPESFSSSYEREVAFTDEIWEARLKNPRARTFVAAQARSTPDMRKADWDELRNVLDGEWVGTAVLVGSLNEVELARGSAASTGIENGSKTPNEGFEIGGLFVLPDARRLGLGRALVEAAVAHAKALALEGRVKELAVNISAVSGNSSALRLYQGLGFEVVDAEPEINEETVRMTFRCKFQD